MKKHDAKSAGVASCGRADLSNLSERDRAYLKAWDTLTPEMRGQMARHGITGPLAVGNDSRPVGRSEEERDPFATMAAPATERYFDEPEQDLDAGRELAGEAVLRVLYILTASRHPGLRLATDCLLAAALNRSDEKNQAAIARKHGLTRAAVQKRMRDMRKGEMLGGLECYFFGGREDVSEKARTRATRVHKRRKELCKTQNQKPSLLALTKRGGK